jgi:hypothetical protein
MVWSFTHLYKSTMRGLFSGEGVAAAYSRPKTEGISNLYQDLEDLMKSGNAYNPYDMSSDMEDGNCYAI